MSKKKSKISDSTAPNEPLLQALAYLKLSTLTEQAEALALEAAQNKWSYLHYLEQLVTEEMRQRQLRARQRRVRQAHFPTIKTLEDFNWSWPKSLDEMTVKQLFRLSFIKNKSNVIFLGGVGLGKTHLASALGYHACLNDHTVLFTTAVEAINNLTAAQQVGRLKQALKKYIKPELLLLDELGYLPIDKHGADLLFQIISQRYERGATVMTSNRAYKDWPEIFNHDATLTSAILDRLLHHAQTILIKGKSYRMKDQT